MVARPCEFESHLGHLNTNIKDNQIFLVLLFLLIIGELLGESSHPKVGRVRRSRERVQKY